MEEKNNPDSGVMGHSRRRFLLKLWIGAQTVLAAIFVVPGLRYFLQPLYDKIQSRRIELGDLRAVPENEPTRIEFSLLKQAGYQVEETKQFVYVLRQKERLKVFSPVCTHMGCNVAWNADATEFQCPCHGGKYNRQGEVIGGPPPKPLMELPAETDQGNIWISLGEKKA